MKRALVVYTLSALIVMATCLTLTGANAYATTAGFKAGNIMDDTVMTNSDSMTASQIQSFLSSKVPSCDTYGQKISEYGGPDLNNDGKVQRWEWGKATYNQTTFNCLKNYKDPNGKSAAQIILEKSKKYSINPQALIVLLQKEQGLVTDTWPLKIQYRTATGYGCPDTAPCDSQYFGLTNQLDWAAKMYHSIITEDPNWYSPYFKGSNPTIYWHPDTSRCGYRNLDIQNWTTASLYSYTPYRPNQEALDAGWGTGNSCSSYGNRNFYSYFTDWFGVTRGTPLIKTSSSSTVYLQSDSTRFGIASSSILRAYGLDDMKITEVSDEYMSSLTDGGVLSTTFMKTGGAAVYVADNGYRFGFASQQQCIDWGFPSCLDPSYTKSLSASTFNLLRSGGALGSILQDGSGLFLMKSGNKQLFLSMKAMSERGYSSDDVSALYSVYNSDQPISISLSSNNSLVRFGTSPTVFAYNQGKYYILSSAVYESLKATMTVHHDAASAYASSPPTSSGTIPRIVSLSNGKTYLFTGGKKFDLSTVAGEWPASTNADSIATIISNGDQSISVSPSSTFRDKQSGMIFKVQNTQALPFYSLADFSALYSPAPYSVDPQVTASLGDGASILAPGAGSAFKSSAQGTEGTIFTLSSDSSTCSIQSMQQLKDFRLRTGNISSIQPPQGSTKALTTITRSTDGSIFAVTEIGKIKTSATFLSSVWGYTATSNSCQLQSSFLANIPTHKSNLGRFIQAKSGTIYYGEAGKKRPISSYAAYLRLGGSSSNTIAMPQDFIDAIPTGTIVY